MRGQFNGTGGTSTAAHHAATGGVLIISIVCALAGTTRVVAGTRDPLSGNSVPGEDDKHDNREETRDGLPDETR